MIVERVSWNLLRATICQLKQFMPLFTRICCSWEVSKVSDQTAFQGDEEGVIQNMPGDHNDDRHDFLTFLGNVLTVGGRLGLKSKLAGLRLIQEVSQKELEVVQRWTSPRRSGGSKSATKNTSTLLGPRLKKNKNKHASSCNCFIFIEIFWELSNMLHTY
jgi:hypothetical protein